MRLVTARVQNYRCISDSGDVPIDDLVTAFVGKNESGKTALLRALHLLNPLTPIKGKVDFDPVYDFPAKDYGKYRMRDAAAPEPKVVTATFMLADTEVAGLCKEFGEGFVRRKTVTVAKGYGGKATYDVAVDEKIAVHHLLSRLQLLESDKAAAANVDTVTGLLGFANAIAEPHSTVTELVALIGAWREQQITLHVIDTYLSKWLPKFFYFDEYSWA
jgi:hypothetical protein